jgi:hypothetical protein
MADPQDQFDEELLSAYVDGELTADERALVEERLRTDPHAAQLVEELRSLSTAIKSLPRETLGRDLRASIQSEVENARSAADARATIPLSEPLDPPRGFRRGFVWSTIAIAAALMLMFLQRGEDQDDRDLAVAKVERQETARRRNRDAALDADKELPSMGEMRADSVPEEKALAMTRDRGSATAPAEPAAPAAPLAPEPASEADVSQMADAAKPLEDKLAVEERLLERAKREEPQQDLLAQGVRGGAAAGAREMAPAPASADAAASKSTSLAASSPAASLATVEVAVTTPQGLAQFDRVLRESGIVAELPPQVTAESAGEVQLEAEFAAKDAESLELKQLRALDPESRVEVLVEGSPAQINQVVMSCQAKPETFATVAVPETLDHFRFYGRAAGPASGLGGVANGSMRADALGGAVTDAAEGEAPEQSQAASQYRYTEDLRDEASAQSRRQLAQAQGQSSAAAAADKNERTALGRAWYLPSSRWGDLAYGAELGIEMRKAKDPATQAGAPLGATAAPVASSAVPGARAPAENELAKATTDQPKAGQVRVKFVLRPAPPTPVAQPAPPANVEP